jgi:hypothetical protein
MREMAMVKQSYITPEIRALLAQEAIFQSTEPVEPGKIRRFANAWKLFCFKESGLFNSGHGFPGGHPDLQGPGAKAIRRTGQSLYSMSCMGGKSEKKPARGWDSGCESGLKHALRSKP